MNVVIVEFFTESDVHDVMFSTLEILKTHCKRIEQHFQYVSQKLMHDKNLDSCADNFAKFLYKYLFYNIVIRLHPSKYFLW